MTRLTISGWAGATAVVVAVLAATLSGAGPALAAGGPVWRITSVADPTHLSGSEGQLVVTATNVGDRSTDGSVVTVADSLPSGLIAKSISGLDAYAKEGPTEEELSLEKNYARGTNGEPLSCTVTPVLSCTDPRKVDPGDQLIVTVGVEVLPGTPSGVVNQATVSGGTAQPGATISQPVTISSEPAAFGIDPASVLVAMSTMQAGAHPDVTVAYSMNTKTLTQPVRVAKDTLVDLPRGLVGSTVGMPRCPMANVFGSGVIGCPPNTIVGIATVRTSLGLTVAGPVANIEPSPGEPAAFAFPVGGIRVRLDTSVLSNGDYGVRVTAADQSQAQPVLSTSVTIWGVPANHQGSGSTFAEDEPPLGGRTGSSLENAALLTNPTQCSTPLSATLWVDPWVDRGAFESVSTSLAPLTGCGLLPFVASASMLPDTLQAGAPAGYAFDLGVQQGNAPEGLATPNVKRVVTTLPQGTVISPSAAQGLTACSDAQFELHSGMPGRCPREAQVGTVRITTPALPQPFSGQVYLASPDCDPCTPEDAQDGKVVRLFLQVIAEGESGIVVKLEGKGSINQQTGQLTVTFDENPQLPFSDLKLTLGGGPRATLANPRTCGPATTIVDLTPWSSPFTPDFSPTSMFEPTGCYAPQFSPSFVAGTTNIQAGAYSPFTMSFGRSDADEFLGGLQLHMPPGLLGSLSSVPLCQAPQAALGTCGQESLIGHTQVLTGPGADPFLVTGGQVFITGPYKGAPFGLSIVVPAKAGPYTLSGTTGNGTVVVRATINIDPHTAELTVTSDPLPSMLDGIPLQLKVVNVTIDRPGFTLNPTNCDRLQVTGTLSSMEGASSGVSSHFQVTNCASLAFKPKFVVSTSGHTSRARGASLDVKVIYPQGAGYANIAKVKVDLPKQLPSQLRTLQQACPAATFNANPGACPPASVVGIAKASTSILPVQLTGPVYFVSHGGEEFPNLIVVLQGDGVRVDLIGTTFISKAGITSSTFKQIPDVPVSSFELYLPEGPHSALAAPGGKLCTSKLTMPTSLVAQNGLVIHQSTPIAVTGCPKAKEAEKASRARASGKHLRSGALHGTNGHGNRGGR